MNKNTMIFIILTIFIYDVSASVYSKTKTNDGVTFSEWISIIVSRGIYIGLISLIVICLAISTYKKKCNDQKLRNQLVKTRKSLFSEVRSDNVDNIGNWFTSFWRTSNFFSTEGCSIPIDRSGTQTVPYSNDVDTLKDKLHDAEVAVVALKQELEIANKGRLELESTMENLELENTTSNEELRKTRLNATLELEKMKKDISALQRQLAQAQSEKISLINELDAISRETRITDAALRDHHNLTSRLETARSEIKSLQDMMEIMRHERDEAVEVATKLIEKAKGETKNLLESRKLIRSILDTAESTEFCWQYNDYDDSGSTIDFESDDALGEENTSGDVKENDSENSINKLNKSGSLCDVSNLVQKQQKLSLSSPQITVTKSPKFQAFVKAAFNANISNEEEI